MNISLPETMKSFVEDRVNTDGYGTASEYVRDLIRLDQKKREQEKLEQVLLKALSSEEKVELTDQVWDNLKAKVRSNLEISKQKK
jgi:antitoxin ParD1/3/4